MTLTQIIEQIRRLPQAIANAVKDRQRQTFLKNEEIERLDRIRNPSKYIGK